MNSLHAVLQTLGTAENEVFVDEAIRVKALKSTQRMLEFAASLPNT